MPAPVNNYAGRVDNGTLFVATLRVQNGEHPSAFPFRATSWKRAEELADDITRTARLPDDNLSLTRVDP